MAIFTEVRFAHENGALADTLVACPDIDARVLPETSTDPARSVSVFTFDNVASETIATALEADRTVERVHPMPEFNERNLWGVEFTDETKLLAPQVTSQGGFVVDARSATPDRSPRGWHERWLLPDREAVHAVWQHARDEGFDFEVLDIHRGIGADTEYPIRNVLTDQQREALLVAYEMGYFAEPREASLAAVADELGHSPSAVGGRIKRGMKALIEATLLVARSHR